MLSVQKFNISAKSFHPISLKNTYVHIDTKYTGHTAKVQIEYLCQLMNKEYLFQLMAVTAMGYLAAWGPFCVLCLWEMIVMPQVKIIYI